MKNAALKVFKNKNFTKRDYECTNLVYAVGETQPEGDFWEETKEFESVDNDIEFATNTTSLYVSCGIRYFGYM